MIINPIIPVWLMGIICVLMLIFKRKGIASYIRQIIIVILLFLVNLRIMIPGKEVANVSNKVDVLFVIDNTISMLAEDYKGKDRRLDGVKKDCEYIINEFSGASFSVITFGNSVEVRVPYTVDATMTLQAIDVLEGQSAYYANGTSLNDVMSEMDEFLENDRETYKLIFFISDGEIMNSEKLKSYKDLKSYVDGGAVLGYGTEKGGAMRPRAYAGDDDKREYITYYDDDFNEKKGISKIDEENLKQIASDFGVEYVHMTKQSDIKGELNKLKNQAMKFGEYGENGTKMGYMEVYYLFAIPLLLLLIFDYVYYKRKA